MKTQLLKKRIFIAMVIALAGIQLNAQATFNVTAWNFDIDSGVSYAQSGGATADIVTAWTQTAGFVQSSDFAQSGTYSMKHDFTTATSSGKLQTWRSNVGDEGLVGFTVSEPYSCVAWFYITGSGGVTEGSGTFRTTIQKNNTTTNVNASFDLSGIPLNTWTKLTSNFSGNPDAISDYWGSPQFTSIPDMGTVVYIDSMSFVQSSTLGVNKNTLDGVAVYPNPTQETLNIKSPASSDIVIYNILGATVKSINKANALQEVSVSNLKSGMYFVRIVNNGKVFQDKIIKL